LSTKWKSKLQSELSDAEKKLQTLVEELNVLETEQKSANKERDEFADMIANLELKVQVIERKIASLSSEEDQKENPYKKSVARLKKELADTRAERAELRTDYDATKTIQNRYQYWVKGFRDLRLWVLDSTLAELEMRINNSLVQLGLPRWSVHLAVERENKSGGVTRGFQVDVQSPESLPGSPWKGFGGGVSQRLRIAAEAGLGHLITDRKGKEIGVEFFDEPDQHLSHQGIQDLMGHLQARSQEENKQIWVVTHRAIDYPFDGEMLIRKDENGSAISMV
jgi:DNA repair exonuclease SbcCD ATPase subunit